MKQAKNTGQIVPFYSDQQKQNRFQSCCDSRFGIKTSDCSLNFQITVPGNDCTIELINILTGAVTVLDPTLFDYYFDPLTNEYILEAQNVYFPDGLPTGKHELVITCGDEKCYSEVLDICQFCGFEVGKLKITGCEKTPDCCDEIDSIYIANVPTILLLQNSPTTFGFAFSAVNFVNAIVLNGALALNCTYTLEGSNGNAFFLTTTINTASTLAIPAAAFPLTFTIDKTFVYPCGGTTALITMQVQQVIQEPVSIITSINLVNNFTCEGPPGEAVFTVEACDTVTSKKVYEAICFAIPDQGGQTVVGSTAQIPSNETGSVAVQRKLRTDCMDGIQTVFYLITFDPEDPCGTYEINEV